MNTLILLGFLAGSSPDDDAVAALALAKAARDRSTPVVKVEPVASVKTGYPIRGNWWTHPGEIHAHLMSGEHRGKWSSEWVRSLTNAEAESVHSDDHEGRVKWDYVSGRASTKAASPSPPPVVRYTLPSLQNCPPGVSH